MKFPVDLLTRVSQEELEQSAERYMQNLLHSDPDDPERLTISGSTQAPIDVSSVGIIPLYGFDKQKMLALFTASDRFTAVALYLLDRWWPVEDILRTADDTRNGAVEVKTVGERIVLYVLNRIIYRAREMSHDELPFLCHGKQDYAKILWKDGEAVGFYSVKCTGSPRNSFSSMTYQLPVMDSIFVRKSHRGRGFGLQMLEDYVQSFDEDFLGLRCPLTKSMFKVCEKFLGQYPGDTDLLWEVEGIGEPRQRTNIANRIQAMDLSAVSKTLSFSEETTQRDLVMEEISTRLDDVKSMKCTVEILEEVTVLTVSNGDMPVVGRNQSSGSRRRKTKETSEKVIRVEDIEAETPNDEQVSVQQKADLQNIPKVKPTGVLSSDEKGESLDRSSAEDLVIVAANLATDVDSADSEEVVASVFPPVETQVQDDATCLTTFSSNSLITVENVVSESQKTEAECQNERQTCMSTKSHDTVTEQMQTTVIDEKEDTIPHSHISHLDSVNVFEDSNGTKSQGISEKTTKSLESETLTRRPLRHSTLDGEITLKGRTIQVTLIHTKTRQTQKLSEESVEEFNEVTKKLPEDTDEFVKTVVAGHGQATTEKSINEMNQSYVTNMEKEEEEKLQDEESLTEVTKTVDEREMATASETETNDKEADKQIKETCQMEPEEEDKEKPEEEITKAELTGEDILVTTNVDETNETVQKNNTAKETINQPAMEAEEESAVDEVSTIEERTSQNPEPNETLNESVIPVAEKPQDKEDDGSIHKLQNASVILVDIKSTNQPNVTTPDETCSSKTEEKVDLTVEKEREVLISVVDGQTEPKELLEDLVGQKDIVDATTEMEMSEQNENEMHSRETRVLRSGKKSKRVSSRKSKCALQEEISKADMSSNKEVDLQGEKNSQEEQQALLTRTLRYRKPTVYATPTHKYRRSHRVTNEDDKTSEHVEDNTMSEDSVIELVDTKDDEINETNLNEDGDKASSEDEQMKLDLGESLAPTTSEPLDEHAEKAAPEETSANNDGQSPTVTRVLRSGKKTLRSHKTFQNEAEKEEEATKVKLDKETTEEITQVEEPVTAELTFPPIAEEQDMDGFSAPVEDAVQEEEIIASAERQTNEEVTPQLSHIQNVTIDLVDLRKNEGVHKPVSVETTTVDTVQDNSDMENKNDEIIEETEAPTIETRVLRSGKKIRLGNRASSRPDKEDRECTLAAEETKIALEECEEQNKNVDGRDKGQIETETSVQKVDQTEPTGETDHAENGNKPSPKEPNTEEGEQCAEEQNEEEMASASETQVEETKAALEGSEEVEICFEKVEETSETETNTYKEDQTKPEVEADQKTVEDEALLLKETDQDMQDNSTSVRGEETFRKIEEENIIATPVDNDEEPEKQIEETCQMEVEGEDKEKSEEEITKAESNGEDILVTNNVDENNETVPKNNTAKETTNQPAMEAEEERAGNEVSTIEGRTSQNPEPNESLNEFVIPVAEKAHDEETEDSIHKLQEASVILVDLKSNNQLNEITPDKKCSSKTEEKLDLTVETEREVSINIGDGQTESNDFLEDLVGQKEMVDATTEMEMFEQKESEMHIRETRVLRSGKKSKRISSRKSKSSMQEEISKVDISSNKEADLPVLEGDLAQKNILPNEMVREITSEEDDIPIIETRARRVSQKITVTPRSSRRKAVKKGEKNSQEEQQASPTRTLRHRKPTVYATPTRKYRRSHRVTNEDDKTSEHVEDNAMSEDSVIELVDKKDDEIDETNRNDDGDKASSEDEQMKLDLGENLAPTTSEPLDEHAEKAAPEETSANNDGQSPTVTRVLRSGKKTLRDHKTFQNEAEEEEAKKVKLDKETSGEIIQVEEPVTGDLVFPPIAEETEEVASDEKTESETNQKVTEVGDQDPSEQKEVEAGVSPIVQENVEEEQSVVSETSLVGQEDVSVSRNVEETSTTATKMFFTEAEANTILQNSSEQESQAAGEESSDNAEPLVEKRVLRKRGRHTPTTPRHKSKRTYTKHRTVENKVEETSPAEETEEVEDESRQKQPELEGEMAGEQEGGTDNDQVESQLGNAEKTDYALTMDTVQGEAAMSTKALENTTKYIIQSSLSQAGNSDEEGNAIVVEKLISSTESESEPVIDEAEKEEAFLVTQLLQSETKAWLITSSQSSTSENIEEEKTLLLEEETLKHEQNKYVLPLDNGDPEERSLIEQEAVTDNAEDQHASNLIDSKEVESDIAENNNEQESEHSANEKAKQLHEETLEELESETQKDIPGLSLDTDEVEEGDSGDMSEDEVEPIVITRRDLRGRSIPGMIITPQSKYRRSSGRVQKADKSSSDEERSPQSQMRSNRKRRSTEGTPGHRAKRHSRV